MKVYFKNKEYNVSQVDRITPVIAEKFADLAGKLKEDPNYNEYMKAMSNADLTNDNIEKLAKAKENKDEDISGLGSAKLSQILKAEFAVSKGTYIKENTPINIQICQLITKDTSVPKTIRNEFYGETDNEFWQEQDIQEIKKAVHSFRKRLFGYD